MQAPDRTHTKTCCAFMLVRIKYSYLCALRVSQALEPSRGKPPLVALEAAPWDTVIATAVDATAVEPMGLAAAGEERLNSTIDAAAIEAKAARSKISPEIRLSMHQPRGGVRGMPDANCA